MSKLIWKLYNNKQIDEMLMCELEEIYNYE